MRKLLTILLMLVSLTVSADKWYIATAANGGDDSDGDGSIEAPWLTLKHACDTVTGANFVGDTIVVGEGTFTETAQSVLSVGVSIYGAGVTSIIKSSVTGAIAPWDIGATIALESSSEGTEGNQSISYLYFDGDSYTADQAINVYKRSNVEIHHCTFFEWHHCAVRFRGGGNTTYYIRNRQLIPR